MNRRTYLTTAAGAGLAALAGCSTAVGEIAAPEVPQSRLEEGGWEKTGEERQTLFEESYGPVTVTAKSHSVSYGDTELRQSVREKTLGEIDAQLAVFSATRIDFAPDLNNLPAGVGRKQIEDQTEQSAREEFESQMESVGLQEITQTSTGTLTVDSGKEARLTEYEATYPVEPFRTEYNGETIELELDDLTVAGDLAVWHDGDYTLVGAGAYPASNVAGSKETALSDAISVTVDVDLGLTPDDYAEEVRGLVTGVQ